MYLDVTRTDPDLLPHLTNAVSRGDNTSVHIGPSSVSLSRLRVPSRTWTSSTPSARHERWADSNYHALAVAAALSLWVQIHAWKDGTAYRRG
jgi:hypothetical protein